ncbi:MAG TPA: hypothetical protein VKQ30_23845 [Ktedonobacterales bacterium]|nr:hypothetical protein [Ktedonobacterales bacterium]
MDFALPNPVCRCEPSLTQRYQLSASRYGGTSYEYANKADVLRRLGRNAEAEAAEGYAEECRFDELLDEEQEAYFD